MPGPRAFPSQRRFIHERQYAMNMVWHDHQRIDFDMGKMT